jgi:hypothetical protein
MWLLLLLWLEEWGVTSLTLILSLQYLWLDSAHVIVLSYYIGFLFPMVDPAENTAAQAALTMRKIASQLIAVASMLTTTHLSYVSKCYFFPDFHSLELWWKIHPRGCNSVAIIFRVQVPVLTYLKCYKDFLEKEFKSYFKVDSVTHLFLENWCYFLNFINFYIY